MFYTIYIGGGRKDFATGSEDLCNVEKVKALINPRTGRALIRDGDNYCGSVELVMDDLVSISYIYGELNLDYCATLVKNTGVSKFTVVCHGYDAECLKEVSLKTYYVA